MANDTTDTTDTHDIEYPVTGYDATPDWATLYGQASSRSISCWPTAKSA